MTTIARANRWRALGSPELLPTLRQIDNLVPFFSKQDLAILRAVVTSLRAEVARPMVRAPSVEAASEFFLGSLPTVTEILSALAQLVGARINGARDATAHLADSVRAQEHPAWKTVVIMGKVAVPYMLAELGDPERRSWSAALRVITGESPMLAPLDRGDPAKMAEAWRALRAERGWLEERRDAGPDRDMD